MKKVLFVATVVKGHIDVFHVPYLKMFKEKGWETTVIARNNFENKNDCTIPYCDNYYDLPFERNPLKFNNLLCFTKLKKIIKNEKFDIIHCHTPVGSVVTRLAAKKYKKNNETKIIYTAHGFHFFKGAPLKNHLVFYPVEKYLSRFTDILITMNEEDYNLVENKFKVETSILVPGVGIDLNKFKQKTIEQINELRVENGIEPDEFVLIYVGELSYRKNQRQLIEVANNIKTNIVGLKILLVGTGEIEEELKELVNKQGLEDIVKFLGYRKDISDLMNLSDVVISTSRQEGLPVNLLEALAVGKPIVATSCRGNRDLVENNINGYLSNVDDIEKMSKNIINLYNDREIQHKFSQNSLIKVKEYEISGVIKKMEKIYFD